MTTTFDPTAGFTQADLGWAIATTSIHINGFQHPERAPLPMLTNVVRTEWEKRPRLQRALARVWAERNSELAAEAKELATKLKEDPEHDPLPWLTDLGTRLGAERAVQAVSFADKLYGTLAERLLDGDLYVQAKAAWEAAAETAAGEVAPAELEPPVETTKRAPKVKATSEEPKAKALAGEVKDLQRRLKIAQAERKEALRSLEAAEARAETFRKELQRVQSERDALKFLEWPEPRERTRKLVEALAKAWRDQDELRTELARAAPADVPAGEVPGKARRTKASP